VPVWLLHRADEAHAFARDGTDQALLASAIAHRLARGIDAAGQRRIGHDATAPHCRDQIVLTGHSVAILDEVKQQVKNLGLQRDEVGAAA